MCCTEAEYYYIVSVCVIYMRLWWWCVCFFSFFFTWNFIEFLCDCREVYVIFLSVLWGIFTHQSNCKFRRIGNAGEPKTIYFPNYFLLLLLNMFVRCCCENCKIDTNKCGNASCDIHEKVAEKSPNLFKFFVISVMLTFSFPRKKWFAFFLCAPLNEN